MLSVLKDVLCVSSVISVIKGVLSVGELPPWVGVMLPFVVDPLGVVDLSKYGKYPVGPPVVGFAVVGVLDFVNR